jgi:hypothetical protein
VGLGLLYAPTGWPLLAPLVNLAYGLWAAARLKLTGRPDIEQLCALRGGRCGGVTGGTAAVKDGRSAWESASATRP